MVYENYISVLYIDMETQNIRVEKREDLKKYLGGVGVATVLLKENMHKELDPLDPKQPIIIAIGALNGIYPVITKAVAMFISPLTGEMGESYAGGRLGMSMFNAGIDAMVITGKAKKPNYLSIVDYDVVFRDARLLWNREHAGDITGAVIRENESKSGSGSGKRTIIHIGKAGEHEVSYACVTVDRYRHFGRLGLGALFGSKNLKAISIQGKRILEIQDHNEYFKVNKELINKCTKTDLMKKYHDQGTAVNVEVLNGLHSLPTLNLQQSEFEFAEDISGEAFGKNALLRKLACAGCPVGCIHIGQFKRSFGDNDSFDFEPVAVPYDYELIFSLGSFLGLKDPIEIMNLIETVEDMGLDAMSTGVCLGWATEALEKGIISEEQTEVKLKFGSFKEYVTAIRNIATCKNQFYLDLARGVKHASKVYGGRDFAMQVAGNEMPGYHTGYGSVVGYAVGTRHSHLCNGGYSFDQGVTKLSPDEIVENIFKEEIERCMLNSLTICLFARKVYDRETIIKAFKAVKVDITNEELDEIAKRTYVNKLLLKKELGFDLSDIKLPKRFFETQTLNGVLNETVAEDMIRKIKAKNEALIKEYS